jgi:hypothetical protein
LHYRSIVNIKKRQPIAAGVCVVCAMLPAIGIIAQFGRNS